MFDRMTDTSSGGTLTPADVNGHLLVVEPKEYIESMTTSNGDTAAVRVTVHDITDSKTVEDVLWFPKILVSKCKEHLNGRLLVVMGQGDPKPGKTAPWKFVDATGNADAVNAATAYMTAKVASAFTPAAPVGAPAAPVGAPAAPAANTGTLDAALANLHAAGLTA